MHLTSTALSALLATCIGRRDDYALQQANGRYLRVGRPLTAEALWQHLTGMHTLGTYIIDAAGWCRFAVFDSDRSDGITQLLAVQRRLTTDNIPSYLEASRRGGHLWVFLASRCSPVALRHWLMPYYASAYADGEMEFYPKQEARPGRPGSLMRVPLGVHRLTGRRYPFVQMVNGQLMPLARTLSATLSLLATAQRARVPAAHMIGPPHAMQASPPTTHTLQNRSTRAPLASKMTIRDWCQQQDPLTVIGHYVALDERGMGCCPFGSHHADGVDSHPSLWVYTPRFPDVCCWYCHVWQRGGSLFDFLKLSHSLDARTLWQRLLAGETF